MSRIKNRKGLTGESIVEILLWAIFIAGAGYGVWLLVQKLMT
jgi:hypothetical protein